MVVVASSAHGWVTAKCDFAALQVETVKRRCGSVPGLKPQPKAPTMAGTGRYRYQSPRSSAASSPASSLSLESFPSLSSLSLSRDDDADDLVQEGSELNEHRGDPWTRPDLDSIGSDEEDDDLNCGGDATESMDDAVDVCDSDEEAERLLPDEENEDSTDVADDEAPDLVYRRGPRPRESMHLSPVTSTPSQQQRLEDDTQQELPSESSSRRRSFRSRSRLSHSASIKSEPRSSASPAVASLEPMCRVSTTQHETHFQALFVRVDPPLLRSLRHLELSGCHLNRTELSTLVSNLFLFDTLRSISLADNQLDDSCVKQLRAIVCLAGLQHADLSRNLLGRGVARMIADRLKHRLTLRTLNICGNSRLFAFDDAADVARALAQGLVSNDTIAEFRVSVPIRHPHLECDRLLLPQSAAEGALHTQRGRIDSRRSISERDQDKQSSPAEVFTKELARELSADARTSRALLSLGIMYAELSRRSVVNLMKTASTLLALDLSFAFIGIQAAQVVATALKMKDYATLTQLNLRGNRLKSMGMRAICKALQTNTRLTDLNVSRNDIRSDILDDLAATFRANDALVRIDLTQNDELFVPEASHTSQLTGWKALLASVSRHHALRSLGDLSRLLLSGEQRVELQKALEANMLHNDELVLLAVQQSMAFETPLNMGRSNQGDKAASEGNLVPPITLSVHQDAEKEKTLWRQRDPILKQSRVSVKWKMAAFSVPRSIKSRSSTNGKEMRIVRDEQVLAQWRVVVHRKCGLVQSTAHEAARGTVAVNQSPNGTMFALCSALAYCDEGDFVSIVIGLADDNREEPGRTSEPGVVKVLGKDVVVLPHPIKSRHLLFKHDAMEDQTLPVAIQWGPKRVRNAAIDPFTHLALLPRVYISHTTRYRLVWRVQLPASTSVCSLEEMVQARFRWRVTRCPCWDLRDMETEQEMQVGDAVLRTECELVFVSEAIELLAGEMVQVTTETVAPEDPMRLVQYFVMVEIDDYAAQETQRGCRY